ncbi:MAG TPA: DNA-binding protein WhiA [Tissierellaceae bacterium]|nr:DNA-binding protein WhiA [Tissierellaceae bacterium]
MSFSASTKNEICRIPIEEFCCALAELAAFVRMSGTIKILGGKQINLNFTTENAAIARRIFTILKELYDTEVQVVVRRNRQLKKNNNYLIMVNNSSISKRILKDVGFIDKSNQTLLNSFYKVDGNLIGNRCCKRSYIRASFLGGGSISNPEKSYHLELVTSNQEHGKDLSKIINSFGLKSKIVLRKDNHVIYIKEGEQIVDFLNIVGAHQALLKFEDIRVLKDVRNNINRLVNCETANLGKTIDASMRQIEDIKLVQRRLGLNKLPKNLREVAELRLSHREASLKEIGKMLNPPVSKSGVNHRFRKITQIARELGGDK